MTRLRVKIQIFADIEIIREFIYLQIFTEKTTRACVLDGRSGIEEMTSAGRGK